MSAKFPFGLSMAGDRQSDRRPETPADVRQAASERVGIAASGVDKAEQALERQLTPRDSLRTGTAEHYFQPSWSAQQAPEVAWADTPRLPAAEEQPGTPAPKPTEAQPQPEAPVAQVAPETSAEDADSRRLDDVAEAEANVLKAFEEGQQ